MPQPVVLLVKARIFHELFISRDSLAHSRGQRRLRLVKSNKDIAVSFELKRRGVDIEGISVVCQ